MWRRCCGDVVGFSRISLSFAMCASMFSMVEYNGLSLFIRSPPRYLNILPSRSANRSILSECTDAMFSNYSAMHFNSFNSSEVRAVQLDLVAFESWGNLYLCEYHNMYIIIYSGSQIVLIITIKLFEVGSHIIANTFCHWQYFIWEHE